MHRLFFRRTFSSPPSRLTNQAHPLSGYYQLLLEKPFTPANAVVPPEPPSPPPPAPPTTTITTTTESGPAERLRVVFGSRLAGPGERADAKKREAKIVAGVRIPPKPVEPDNCCMSGCVNCVWDVFRQDLEDYREARMEARRRMEAQGKLGEATKSTEDDDEGGVTAGGGLWEGFDEIPVGIKAFMETEKRLQAKHKSAG